MVSEIRRPSHSVERLHARERDLEQPMAELTKTFRDIVGEKNVLTRELDTAYYRTGFRYGFGGALAVVFPSTLVEQWRVLQAAVDAGCAIIMQATKTGLTGGSSPRGTRH